MREIPDLLPPALFNGDTYCGVSNCVEGAGGVSRGKSSDKRDDMKEKSGIPVLMPPALFNGDTYCGVLKSVKAIGNTYSATLGRW